MDVEVVVAVVEVVVWVVEVEVVEVVVEVEVEVHRYTGLSAVSGEQVMPGPLVSQMYPVGQDPV